MTLRIGIILGSTRTGRFADRPAKWLLDIAQKRHQPETATYELVDLRDYPLPFFDEPKSPLREPSKNEVAVRWANKVRELDAFIFVNGEYNHGIPASLKNALDYLYEEWNRKPASAVSYGNAGGARGVEQLRLNLIELQAAPIRSAVHIPGAIFMDIMLKGKQLEDFPNLAPSAEMMLDDLLWWAKALKSPRDESRGT